MAHAKIREHEGSTMSDSKEQGQAHFHTFKVIVFRKSASVSAPCISGRCPVLRVAPLLSAP